MYPAHLKIIFNQMADDSWHEAPNYKDLILLCFWIMG